VSRVFPIRLSMGKIPLSEIAAPKRQCYTARRLPLTPLKKSIVEKLAQYHIYKQDSAL
jgi:hypothetical protein